MQQPPGDHSSTSSQASRGLPHNSPALQCAFATSARPIQGGTHRSCLQRRACRPTQAPLRLQVFEAQTSRSPGAALIKPPRSRVVLSPLRQCQLGTSCKENPWWLSLGGGHQVYSLPPRAAGLIMLAHAARGAPQSHQASWAPSHPCSPPTRGVVRVAAVPFPCLLTKRLQRSLSAHLTGEYQRACITAHRRCSPRSEPCRHRSSHGLRLGRTCLLLAPGSVAAPLAMRC